ncbi:MAG: RNA methyltransferase [Defluviitaleaceae bacterium]|nr:RNA methyltransferase [Defluviitaleaceae bacterium]
MHILKQLKIKKGRDDSGLFVVEGIKFVTEIPADWHIVRFILSEKFVADVKNTALIARCKGIAPMEILRDAVFASYVETQTPQGIAAVCRQRVYTLDDFASATPDGFFLLGENLQDPGNVGTLIRTAAAAGAAGVIFTTGSADIYGAKVQRAAAGAALRMPMVGEVTTAEALKWLAAQNIPLYAAHPRGDTLPYTLDMKKRFCLLIGNEARGISEEASAGVDTFVRLPMAENNESLNAATAGSILLYEVVRQRCA